LKKPILLLTVLSICCVISQSAMAAESQLGLKAIGPTLGMVGPEDVDATLGFGAMADHGMITPNIRLTSHMDFWSKSEEAFGAKASIRDIALGARGEYLLPTNSKFSPFAGAGLGLHFLHSEVDVPGFGSVDDGTTRLGLDIGGGFSTPMSARADFRSDVWYGIVDNASQWSLKAAMMFKLGQ